MDKNTFKKGLVCILGGPIGTALIVAGEYANLHAQFDNLKRENQDLLKYMSGGTFPKVYCHIDRSKN